MLHNFPSENMSTVASGGAPHWARVGSVEAARVWTPAEPEREACGDGKRSTNHHEKWGFDDLMGVHGKCDGICGFYGISMEYWSLVIKHDWENGNQAGKSSNNIGGFPSYSLV